VLTLYQEMKGLGKKRQRLFRGSVRGAVLTLFLVIGTLLWTVTSQSGLQFILKNSQPFLPQNLSFERIEGNLWQGFTAHRVTWQDDKNSISADQAFLQIQLLDLLQQKITVQQGHIKHLTVSTKANTSSTPNLPLQSLPWPVSIHAFAVDQLLIDRGARQHLIHQIQLSGQSAGQSIHIQQLHFSYKKVTVYSKGRIELQTPIPVNLAFNWHTVNNQSHIKGHGTLSGHLNQLQLEHHFQGPTDAVLSGQVLNLTNHPSLNLKGSWTRLPKFSETLAIGTGKIHINGQIQALNIRVKADTDIEQTTIPAEINVNLTSQRWSLDQLTLHSPQGLIRAKGHYTPSTQKWQTHITGNAINPARWIPQWEGTTAFSLNAYGEQEQEHTNIHSLMLEMPNGTLNSQGQIQFSSAPTWKLKTTISKLDLQSHLPQWRTTLNANISHHGSLGKKPSATFDVSHLKSTLNKTKTELNGRGYFTWQPNILTIQAFELTGKHTDVHITGDIKQPLSLQWVVNSDNLQEIYPTFKGKVHSQGKITALNNSFNIQTQTHIERLTVGDLSVQELLLKGDLHNHKATPFNISAKLKGIQWQQQHIKVADITLQGTHAKQQLNITSQLPDGKWVAEATGSHNKTSWHWLLTKNQLNSSTIGDWQLENPTALSITSQSAQLNNLCMVQPGADLCIKGNWQDSTHFHSMLTFSALPNTLFSRWLPGNLTWKGQSQGLFLFQQDGLQPSANFNWVFQPGTLTYQQRNQSLDLPYGQSSLNGTLFQNQLTVTTTIDLNKGGYIKQQFSLDNLLQKQPDKMPLNIHSEFSLNDLALTEAFFPDIASLNGTLQGQIMTSGTLVSPHLEGQLSLTDASANINPLGITLTNTQLKLSTGQQNVINIEGEATSNKGTLKLLGGIQLNPQNGWPAHLTIKGESFELIKLPHYQASISPDITLSKIPGEALSIKGAITVPKAQIKIVTLPTSAITQSSDVIIVNGPQHPPKSPPKTLPLSTDIQLTLGNQVHFQGFHLKTQLKGLLHILDTPRKPTQAYGNIDVTQGLFDAYGQNFTIDTGQLIFNGGIENPQLNAKMSRKIDQQIQVGIMASGSAKAPSLTLFSTPAMDRSNILSYLVTGDSLDNANQNQGKVLLQALSSFGLSEGKTLSATIIEKLGLKNIGVNESSTSSDLDFTSLLSPKIHASYGVDLFNQESSLHLNYDVTPHIQVKAGGGKSSQGIDLLYSIEFE
jgi:translocation and assembly module TamB